MRVLKKFIHYYKPYQAVFWIDMACALLVSVIDLAFPQLLNYCTRSVFTRSAEEVLRILPLLAFGLLVMYLARFGGRYYITCQGHIMGARMESDMRQDLFDQFQRLSFSYYDRNNTGEMMSKLVSDLFDISELAHHGPENIFISLLKIFGSFALLLWINVPMTLILLAVTLIMLAFSVWQNKKMRAVFMDNRRKIAGVNASLQDSLAGIRVVKSFANESVEHKKFSESNLEFLRSKDKNYKRMGIFHAGNNFFQGMLFLTVLVSGGYFIAAGQIDAVDLATYALYINIFINPIEVLVEFTEMFQKGFSGFKRFLEVMETQPEIVDRPDARPLQNVHGVIDYRDVSFHYEKGDSVLSHIDIHIDAGKTVALVGPSGGGKTTLCNLIPRFYDVTGGEILIDGQNVRDVTLHSLRDAIGVVQQDVYLFSGTVAENIAYGKPGASQAEIEQAARLAGADGFVRALKDGYNTYVGERGVKLSGGQKQRIAIARVFLKNPPILLLDEATSALDNESEILVGQSLDKLAKGRTTLTIAHRLTTIQNADRILVLGKDGIEEEGNHTELLAKKGIYYRLWNGLVSGQTL